VKTPRYDLPLSVMADAIAGTEKEEEGWRYEQGGGG
jgi:hypothetical protein